MKQFSLPLFLLLFSLSACATEKKTPAATAPVNEKAIAEEIKNQNKETKDLTIKAKDCVCIKMWMPVCGSDFKTYGNSCEANCRGVSFTQGECQAKK